MKKTFEKPEAEFVSILSSQDILDASVNEDFYKDLTEDEDNNA